jgi:hypothetical protein
VSDESTAVLQGQLEWTSAGAAEARRRLLELARDRLTRHAASCAAPTPAWGRSPRPTTSSSSFSSRSSGTRTASGSMPAASRYAAWRSSSATPRRGCATCCATCCARPAAATATAPPPCRWAAAPPTPAPGTTRQQRARRGAAAALDRVPRGGGPAAGRPAGGLRPAVVSGAVAGRGRRLTERCGADGPRSGHHLPRGPDAGRLGTVRHRPARRRVPGRGRPALGRAVACDSLARNPASTGREDGPPGVTSLDNSMVVRVQFPPWM